MECSVDINELGLYCWSFADGGHTNSPSLACIFCFIRYVHCFPPIASFVRLSPYLLVCCSFKVDAFSAVIRLLSDDMHLFLRDVEVG